MHHAQESRLPTLDAIVEEKRQRKAQRIAAEEKKAQMAQAALLGEEQPHREEEQAGGMDGLEDEADQQGAFNPETGEINWDCPCLGGMAHGPCGEEFKAAFSCFVYSNEEPKGMECIEKFKCMQDCFRQHPDMYGSELEDDEDEVEEELQARGATQTPKDALTPPSSPGSEVSPQVSPATSQAAEQKSTTEE
jgi:intermembrane space import and assembly protein 40